MRATHNTESSRYRTKNLKRFIQGLVFKGILKGQESKSWDFFEGPRRFRGPQKSEKFYFSKRTKTSVDHKFKSSNPVPFAHSAYNIELKKSFEFQFYTKKSCFANNSEHFDRKVTRAF